MLRRIAEQMAQPFTTHALPRPTSGTWTKAASVSVGILTAPLFAANTVLGHDEGFLGQVKHAIQEICEHAIWHKIGHYALGLGSLGSGLLGGIFSFRTLGETEGHLITSASKPTPIERIDPKTGKKEPGLRLPNGKQLFGQEVLDLQRLLYSVMIVKSLDKGKR